MIENEKSGEIFFTYENSAGVEVRMQLPTLVEQCGNCDGEGSHLCEGMRGACYSTEEFNEQFDEEEQEEYFRPRGRFDEQCQECSGSGKVHAVALDFLPPEVKKAYEDYLDAEYYAERERAAERRMGC